jgi:glycosyltransferase involved in cell wall biosynthesis
MRFSVIICTKNRAASLARALAAIEQLATSGERETIVVDNASTDDTPQVVAHAASRSEHRIAYLRCEQPGKSAALNTGIAAARGEILVFTDDDAIPATDWLQQIDRVFRAHRCEWVFGRVVPAWEVGPPAWFSTELNGLFALMDLGPDSFVATTATPAFYGVNCAAARPALSRLGGYRVDLGPTTLDGGGGEDTEMFERALADGQRVIYDPSVIVTHVIPRHRTSRKFHRRRMWAGGANNYQLILKSPWNGRRRFLGIPSYHFRLAADDVGAFVRAVVALNASQAFYREMRLVRLASVLSHAVARRLAPVLRRQPIARATNGNDSSLGAA